MELFLVVMATFWAWETFRLLAETFVPSLFAVSRPAHPILAAALPMFLLWPEWVSALAVAGVVALMVAATDLVFRSTPAQQIQIPRRRNSQGLPPLP